MLSLAAARSPIAVLLALLMPPGGSGNLDKPPEVQTVCSLMPRLRQFRNRIVAVKGELFSGTEILALGSTDCPTRFATGRLKWPAALDLVTSEYKQEGEPPAPFKTAAEAHRELENILSETSAIAPGRKVVLEITGFLRVRREYRVSNSAYGSIGNGYGHLGAYPAQLVIKTIDKVYR